MNKKLVPMMICIFVALAGCSVQHQSNFSIKMIERDDKQMPPPDFFPKDYAIVSVGDSLTQGVGDIDNKGGYIPYLSSKLDENPRVNHTTFQNFGVSGHRTDQLLKRLNQNQLKQAIEHADIVIITIGGNDVMEVFRHNVLELEVHKFVAAESGYRTRLTDIFNKIRSYNKDVSIILVGIYNPFINWFSDIQEVNEIVGNWNDASASVVAEYEQVNFVPIADIFARSEEILIYSDYFHPNNEGYERIAERIYTVIENEDILIK